jgi:hypothetical protein
MIENFHPIAKIFAIFQLIFCIFEFVMANFALAAILKISAILNFLETEQAIFGLLDQYKSKIATQIYYEIISNYNSVGTERFFPTN